MNITPATLERDGEVELVDGVCLSVPRFADTIIDGWYIVGSEVRTEGSHLILPWDDVRSAAYAKRLRRSQSPVAAVLRRIPRVGRRWMQPGPPTAVLITNNALL